MAATADEKDHTRHWIFGFGSLISQESRARTGDSGEAHVATILGCERRWSHRVALPDEAITNKAITGVSAVAVHFPKASSSSSSSRDSGVEEEGAVPQTAGVLIEIVVADLHKYDARELGYERVRVEPLARVLLPCGGDPCELLGQGAAVWCYASPPPPAAAAAAVATGVAAGADGLMPGPVWPVPDASFPVIQSYLDVILHGCWTVGGEDFARNFLLTTHGWGAARGSFLDDREKPGYIRSSPAAASHAERWDALLSQAALVSQRSHAAKTTKATAGKEEGSCEPSFSVPCSVVSKTLAPAGALSLIDHRIAMP